LSRRVTIVNFRMKREIAMVQALLRSIVLRIRLRSRILRKQDIEIKEIC